MHAPISSSRIAITMMIVKSKQSGEWESSNGMINVKVLVCDLVSIDYYEQGFKYTTTEFHIPLELAVFIYCSWN